MTDDIPALRVEDIVLAQSRSGTRSFPSVLESAYRQNLIDNQRRAVIAHLLIAVGLSDAFLINDYFVAGHDLLLYAIGRLGVTTPVCLLALAIALRYRRAYEYAVCIPTLTMSAVLSVLIFKTHGAYRTEYLFGDILVMMCGSVITRSRLRFASLTIMLQCAFYVTTVLATDVMPAVSLLVSLLFCLSGAIVSLLTAHAFEQSSRSSFLLSMRVTLLNRELEAAANTDPLTGLANRRCLAHAADGLWAPTSGDPATVSMILIDVDRFKSFNDNYGHPAGDRCLATIAKQVSSAIRAKDALAVRFGGEELLVLLPHVSLAAAQSIAERIRLAIIDARIPHPALAPDAVVTASLGVATGTTVDCTPLELTALADSALYAAKAAGRNRVWPVPDQRGEPSGGIAALAAPQR